MRKDFDPKELAAIVAKRSTCHVQVGAVIVDKHGVLAWGWNSMGLDGLGLCAERHAIRRANKKRLAHATMYVFALRKKSRGVVTAKPCALCEAEIKRIKRIVYRNKAGEWVTLVPMRGRK